VPRRDVPPPRRSELPELVELRRLRATVPELSPAIDVQVSLVELSQRVRARIPVPWVEVDPAWLFAQQRAGRPLLRFEDLPIAWSDYRRVFRETADVLKRAGAIEAADHDRCTAIVRDADALEPLVVAWYRATAERGGPGGHPGEAETIDHVLLLATRPFLARCAEAILPRLDLSGWSSGYCPLCGGEPEMAVLDAAGDRSLICTRCTGQWPFAAPACPFCPTVDPARLPSFASADGRYRVFACDGCGRYLKAFDTRRGKRPVLLPVDAVATLPLDAAAMQRGYRS
jgi:hypothetical protein